MTTWTQSLAMPGFFCEAPNSLHALLSQIVFGFLLQWHNKLQAKFAFNSS